MKIISILTENEYADAYQLEQLCHPIPWTRETFYANQGERYLNLKITINSKIIGFCICQIVADEANLFNIAINPMYRKQGFAKDLLHTLIDKIMNITLPKPISTVWLEVRKSNISAIKLYESVGFNEITIRKDYYPTIDGKREDAIIMAYTLTL